MGTISSRSDASTEREIASLRGDVGETCRIFANRLRAIKEHLRLSGHNSDRFFETTALFDGPAPQPLNWESVDVNAGFFSSSQEMLRLVRVGPGGSVAEISPWGGSVARFILERFSPSALHLFEVPVDGLEQSLREHPALTLHPGRSEDGIRRLADESLDLVIVNGLTSFDQSRAVLEGVLAKLQPGGYIVVGNYTNWSPLGGIPYGVPAVVNAIANRGAVRVVGFMAGAHGYHQVLLRKPGELARASDSSTSRGFADRAASRPKLPTTRDAAPSALALALAPALAKCLEPFLAEFRAREARDPSILDWSNERFLATAFPGVPVFAPVEAGKDLLPHIDASVDVVAVPAGDSVRLSEARRVATSAVIEVHGEDAAAPAPATIHPIVAAAPPVPAPPVLRRRTRSLEGRRILIVSYYMPQPNVDSYSRRLFHFVGFLRDAGCEVTCVARNPAGVESYSALLTDRGVDLRLDLDSEELEALARGGAFDWAFFGFWNSAAQHLARLRKSAPNMRIVIDSGDVHFLRNARKILRDSDGFPDRLDAAFANDVAREIDVYGAADGVLAVSAKEASLVGDLVGDPARAFAVPDSEDMPASSYSFAKRRGMFFVGNFEHPPNAESLEYLCHRILPHVDPELLAEHPVYIVGSNMSDSVRAITSGVPGIRVVGWAPSVRPYLEQVRLSLIPLLHGAGTKRKMIQALSIGTPSVSTSVGLEGFPIRHDREVFVADDPVAFASGITRLLRDEALWTRLASAGRTAIRKGHVHEVARDRLVDALESVRKNPRRANQAVARSVVDVTRDEPIGCPFRGLTSGHSVHASAAERTRPRISVVIPTRDRAPLLREALASLVGQSVDRDAFEVIVVNDGSTDGTVDVCREFEGLLRLTRVDGPPSGIGLAKNIGTELASAPIVLSFDDDDVADPNLVAAHLDAHDRAPLEHVAVLGFTDWHERLERTEVMRFVTDVGHFLFSYTNLRHGQLLDHTWFWGGRSSCKRSLLVRAGGFRPDFTFGSEDIEAGYRISQMVARERRLVGAAVPEGGLSVIFRRDAVQRMIRPITFDEFCRRCERQGRSQWQYSRFYDDRAVHSWCQTDGAESRWSAARGVLEEKTARVRELERLLVTAADADRTALREELHQLYHWTFNAFKAKGIAEQNEAARTKSSPGP